MSSMKFTIPTLSEENSRWRVTGTDQQLTPTTEPAPDSQNFIAEGNFPVTFIDSYVGPSPVATAPEAPALEQSQHTTITKDDNPLDDSRWLPEAKHLPRDERDHYEKAVQSLEAMALEEEVDEDQKSWDPLEMLFLKAEYLFILLISQLKGTKIPQEYTDFPRKYSLDLSIEVEPDVGEILKHWSTAVSCVSQRKYEEFLPLSFTVLYSWLRWDPMKLAYASNTCCTIASVAGFCSKNKVRRLASSIVWILLKKDKMVHEFHILLAQSYFDPPYSTDRATEGVKLLCDLTRYKTSPRLEIIGSVYIHALLARAFAAASKYKNAPTSKKMQKLALSLSKYCWEKISNMIEESHKGLEHGLFITVVTNLAKVARDTSTLIPRSVIHAISLNIGGWTSNDLLGMAIISIYAGDFVRGLDYLKSIVVSESKKDTAAIFHKGIVINLIGVVMATRGAIMYAIPALGMAYQAYKRILVYERYPVQQLRAAEAVRELPGLLQKYMHRKFVTKAAGDRGTDHGVVGESQTCNRIVNDQDALGPSAENTEWILELEPQELQEHRAYLALFSEFVSDSP
ncbi:hypothetical protein ABW20_dc0110371 [Dactylellina cionopaga]|nr:hypothetical protein ABW20_dc0110371 [Dactylellina cionopaga]